MPRKTKLETGHEKVVPLSLPEVQLSVANSLEGDTVDQRAVQRALQGYQLVLQGSLRDSVGVVTREIGGHAGYYRNLMRGVAQIFGVQKQGDEEELIVRGAYLSDENEDSGSENVFIDEEEPRRKRRALSRTSVERSFLQTGKPDTEKKLSVFAGIQTSAVNSKTGSPTAALNADEDAITPLIEKDPSLPESEAPNLSLLDVRNAGQTTPVRPSTPGHTPFNRYKGRASASLTGTPTASHVRTISHSPVPAARTPSISDPKTVSNYDLAPQSIEQSLNRPSIVETLPNDEIEMIVENLDQEQTMEHAVGVAMNNAHKPDLSQNVSIHADKNLAGSSEMISLKEKRVVLREVAIEEDVSPLPSPKLQTGDENREAYPETPRDKIRTHESPAAPSSELGGDGTPPAPNVKDFPNDVTPEFFGSFITKELTLQNDVKVFYEYDAVSVLEKSNLPGTWLMNNQALARYDFLSPDKTNLYYMIRQIDPEKCGEDVTKHQWQLLLFKNLASQCEAIKNADSEFDATQFDSESYVLVFDSTSIGISPEIVLCVRNFLNGVFRKAVTDYLKPTKPRKKDMDRIRGFVNTMSSSIMLVNMPTQPAQHYSGLYLLRNMTYIFNNESSETLGNLGGHESKTVIPKKNFRIGMGKSKTTTKVSITSIDLPAIYAEDIFG